MRRDPDQGYRCELACTIACLRTVAQDVQELAAALIEAFRNG
jgi:hypothetical protein